MGRKKMYENHAAQQTAKRRENGIPERIIRENGESREQRNAQAQRRLLRRWRDRPIVAIDGEGRDTESGDHLYTLLAAGDGQTTLHVADESGLSSAACFAFLFGASHHYEHSYSRKPLLTIFAGSYDFTMMVKGLDELSIRSLYENGATTEYFGGVRYWIRILPRKLMQITRWISGKKESITIYDVFGFFQSSFVKALIDWKVASPEQLQPMGDMKARRGSFTVDDDAAIREYNSQEISYLVQLAHELRDALDECHMHISSWHGAGAIAGHIMKEHRIKDHIIQRWQEPLETAIKTAYFGGRVQLLQAGIFSTIVVHDVVSAYPSAHATLPSLKNVRASHTHRWEQTEWSLWRVSWRLPDGTPIQPFPLREDSNIYYEQAGSGWYWYPEVAVAREWFGDALTIHEGYVFHTSDEKPFAYITDLFQLRKRYKAQGNAAEKPLKLGYNSHYGKHAQHSERGSTALPAYQCYWYAGYITSVCRARILDLCMRDPYAIVAIATDGVFATKELTYPNEVGSELGQWEQNKHNDFFIVQPGLYTYTDSSGQMKTKTRGLHPTEVNWDALREPYRKNRKLNPTMVVPVATQRFIGLKTACARNRLDTLGTWDRGTRHISLMLHPTRAASNGRVNGHKLTYYGRLDDRSWRNRVARVSEPFVGRYDITNGSEYIAELCEIDDNPEVYGE